ncbi:MAG: helix-turn-helix domain-containing protein [Candidatus Margulisbacteria bacterium]|jgi:DNA-binding XRE family transcriptional regulator|nr:helix-turn-helix domain-containing protein [Candidatus Margulisiibacteriota bacterium]
MSTNKDSNIKTEFGLKFDAKDIGRHITKLRMQQKMTRYRLALCSGIRESVLMQTEKGAREPRLNTVLKIIAGLDLTIADFFSRFNSK